MNAFAGSSSYSDLVDGTFTFILSVCVIMLIGVTAAMIYFAIKYSRKKNPNPAQIHGHAGLEIVWTVIPTILVLMMFWYGWTDYRIMRTPPAGAINVVAKGRMWSWTFEYEGGQASTELMVPVDTPVRLELISEDVIHSFYIPAFRIKEDVMPLTQGRDNNFLWFNAQKIGEYNVFCAEYCGKLHSGMLTKVKVVSFDDYVAWLNSPEAGGDVLALKGCTACHSLDAGTRLVGPSFSGLFGKKETVLTDGVERQITVDEDYVRHSILEPQADIVKGYENEKMTQLPVSGEEIDKIIDRLRELSQTN